MCKLFCSVILESPMKAQPIIMKFFEEKKHMHIDENYDLCILLSGRKFVYGRTGVTNSSYKCVLPYLYKNRAFH